MRLVPTNSTVLQSLSTPSLTHELAILEFEAEIALLKDSEKVFHEDDVVLLGFGTQAHIIDVCLQLGPCQDT